jgi:predicted type IV restriction endonuclease
MNIDGRIWIIGKERKDGKVMREGCDNWPVHMYFQIHMN